MLSDVIFFTFFSAFNFPLSSSHFAASEPSMGWWGKYPKAPEAGKLPHAQSLSLLTVHPSPLVQCLIFARVNEPYFQRRRW